MYVLYVDHGNHPVPITECYHATASRCLSSSIMNRIKPTTITEVDSAYCPQCLLQHDAASASRLGYCTNKQCQQRCPICIDSYVIIEVDTNTTTTTTSNSSTSEDGGSGSTSGRKCYYRCGRCDWSSLECNLYVMLNNLGRDETTADGDTPTTGGSSSNNSNNNEAEEEEIDKLELLRAQGELVSLLNQRRQYQQSTTIDAYHTSLIKVWEQDPTAAAAHQQQQQQQHSTAASIRGGSSSKATSTTTTSLLATTTSSGDYTPRRQQRQQQQQQRRLSASPQSSSNSRSPSSSRTRSNKTMATDDDAWSVEILEAKLAKKRAQNYHHRFDDHDDDFIYNINAQLDGFEMRRISVDDNDDSDDDDDDSDDDDDYDTSLSGLSISSYNLQAMNTPFLITCRNDCLPLPIPLRVRKSRRCRLELADGRPGILLKPKLNPLEGDSSLRTGHGQWWKKDSSAVHVIPRVRVLKHQIIIMSGNDDDNNEKDEDDQQQQKYHAFLLKVINPTLGAVRLRFASSSYEGEPIWDDNNNMMNSNSNYYYGNNNIGSSNEVVQRTPKMMTTTTKLLPSLLVDTLLQKHLNVELNTNVMKNLVTTETVELLSAEDTIIELGGKAGQIPYDVLNWNPTTITNKKASSSNSSSSTMRLVAKSASDAWFELIVPSITLEHDDYKPAIPLQLQVELGDGSWISSLIQPQEQKQKTKTRKGDDEQQQQEQQDRDRVMFDLVIAWEK